MPAQPERDLGFAIDELFRDEMAARGVQLPPPVQFREYLRKQDGRLDLRVGDADGAVGGFALDRWRSRQRVRVRAGSAQGDGRRREAGPGPS